MWFEGRSAVEDALEFAVVDSPSAGVLFEQLMERVEKAAHIPVWVGFDELARVGVVPMGNVVEILNEVGVPLTSLCNDLFAGFHKSGKFRHHRACRQDGLRKFAEIFEFLFVAVVFEFAKAICPQCVFYSEMRVHFTAYANKSKKQFPMMFLGGLEHEFSDNIYFPHGWYWVVKAILRNGSNRFKAHDFISDADHGITSDITTRSSLSV